MSRTAALALVVVAIGGCKKEEAAAPPPPPTVVVAPAVRKDVPVFLEPVAQTVAKDTVDIRARVVGVLESRNFEEGKMVKKGDVLFTIDPREYKAALQLAQARLAKAEADLRLAKEQVSVRSAEANVAQAKARLRKTEQDVARLEPLAAEDAVPKQDLDAAVAARDVARADLDAAEARLHNAKLQEQVGISVASAEVESAKADIIQAELDLGYCTISAPMDGLIGRAEVSVGNLVGRGESTLLVTLSTVDPMRVTFSISEAEYIRFRMKGKDENSEYPPIDLTLADGTAYPHQGAFIVAEREVDRETGTLVIEAEFPNPEKLLRPGQFGRARSAVETIAGAVVIPERAIVQQQSAKVVFVVGKDRKVEMRAVKLGEHHEGMVVVREGVKEGETVIVDGQQKARPGAEVVPVDKPPEEAKKKEGA
jgi:membrane fusion protein (multidrug efflux system)